MFINLTIMNQFEKFTDNVSDSSTLREALEKFDVPYDTGLICVNAAPIKPNDLDKTFEDLGVSGKVFMSRTVKMDNA